MSNFFSYFSIKEQTLFAKRLSFLVYANVPILESLKILSKQGRSRSRNKILQKVVEDVSNGNTLAQSLGKYQRTFGTFAINLIRVGETSGTLDENLNYIAEELKKRQELRRKVFGSLLYPALIVIATLGITGLITVYVFPKVLPIFASLNFELPLTTKILIFVSDFLSSYGLYLIGGILLGAIISGVLITKSKGAKMLFDRFLLRIPLFGKIALNYQLANFTRTLGILTKSGMGLVSSMSITSDTVSNALYRKRLVAMGEGIQKGEGIAAQFEKDMRLFPPTITHLIAIGEKTGSLSETFTYLSEMYENELDELTKSLATAIEPLLMIFMGLLVGFVAVSIITPIYQVTQTLNP